MSQKYDVIDYYSSFLILFEHCVMMSMLCYCCVRELLILARTWFAFGLPSKTGCDSFVPHNRSMCGLLLALGLLGCSGWLLGQEGKLPGCSDAGTDSLLVGCSDDAVAADETASGTSASVLA
jgi:hypothetical protein